MKKDSTIRFLIYVVIIGCVIGLAWPRIMFTAEKLKKQQIENQK
jgi:hypothetical protein